MSAAPADWIITDVRIWTGTGEPPPGTDALALRDGRIAAVGPARELEGLRGEQTAVLPLPGRCLIPGFVDAHVHLQAGGLHLFQVDLRGATTPEAFVQRVADHARMSTGGGWILGGDWDHQLWDGTLPDRSWLDHAAPGRPVFLRRTDMHMGVASSRALELAGITADSPDPTGGVIDRDGREPTGIVRERAMDVFSRIVPPPSPEERRSALRAAVLHALARGVTQLHDMGALHSADESWESLHTLRALRAEQRLPIRVSAAVPLDERRELARFIEEEGSGDALLRWGMVKGFVDGSLGSCTAWFHEPYLGQGDNRGTVISDLDELASGIREAVELGLQPIAHAIGDRATDWLLDVYEDLERDFPDRDVRPRMEHAQHLTPSGLQRAQRSRAVFSVQPLHLVDDGRWASALLGPDRETRSYPFRSLVSQGAHLAMGSDWTVAPVDPIGALQAAVTRRVWEPKDASWGHVWNAEERLGLEDALRAHTLGGARAAFLEQDTGTLEVGKRGDLVVLSCDPFQVDPDALREQVGVEMTFVDGVLAHRVEDLTMGATP
jgi:predicted amidohydrolase YtcJ